VRFGVASLGGSELGYTEGNRVLIDADAAGSGWFIDASPTAGSEFRARLDSGVLAAAPDSAAYGHIDLVSVVEHEIGHVLGFEHSAADHFGVMTESLDLGLRYVLGRQAVASAPGIASSPAATPAFDPFDAVATGLPGATIDWQASAGDGWSTKLSPYASDKPKSSASPNFSSFATHQLGTDAKAASAGGYDRMGCDLLGKKLGKPAA
jgi:hypothetical protein